MVFDPDLFTKLGSPKYVLAPMVDASELAWRMLGRRYNAQLTFTPMINSTCFLSNKKYRDICLQFSSRDRPLICQFCANTPDSFVKAASYVQSFCDAVDLNLGCPQGIARRGHYGAFLQDEWNLIQSIVKLAVEKLDVPVTCKIRIFKEVDRTVKYAQMLEASGVSMITVHGRTREMKGQLTGLADWEQIKAVKQAVNIPVIANGNIQYLDDVHRCLAETNVDGVMSAETHLHNPALFAGLQPRIYSICLEYLDLTVEYPCPIAFIRGHLFKLCHHALCEHPEYRSLIGTARTTDKLREIIQAMDSHCSNCSENVNTCIPHPHWICQPYERPKLVTNEDASSTTQQTDFSPVESLEPSTHGNSSDAKLTLMEERRLRRALKKEAKIAKRQAPTLKHAICSMCNENRRSGECIHSACRLCCRQHLANTCPVHCAGTKQT